MAKINESKIIFNKKLAPDIYRMRILAPLPAKHARPGQILHIKCGNDSGMVLRRPISVCSADPESGTLDIVYQAKGKGTDMLAAMEAGAVINYLGPQGKFYDISSKYKHVAVIGGGIGVFPLLLVLEYYNRLRAEGKAEDFVCDAFLGFRTRSLVVLENDFRAAADKVHIVTDDGTYGRKALCVEPFLEQNALRAYDIIYACGPGPMIKKVCEIAAEVNVPCQVSLEQRMACGIGACLVCVCKIRGENGEPEFRQVCKEGPVFWSKDVIFD